MKKKVISLFLIFTSLSLQPVLPVWGEKVVIVLSRSAGPYNATLRGFKKSAQFEFEVVNMEGDSKRGRQIMQSVSKEDTNLVVTIGTEAVIAAKALNPAIPIFYTMVLDPVHFSEHNASAILIRIKIKEQFIRMKKLLPTKKRIGLIYNPHYSSKDVDEARHLSGEYGLQLCPIAVQKQEEIPDALNKFTRNTVDLLWMVVDETTTRPVVVKQLIQHSLKERLPLIALSMYHVKAGALAAFSVDFFDLGAQAADNVPKIVNHFVKNRIETPRKIIIYVNPKILNHMGIDELSVFPEVKYIK